MEFDKEEIERIVKLGLRKSKTWEIELLHQLMMEYGGKSKMCMCKAKNYFTFASKWLKELE